MALIFDEAWLHDYEKRTGKKAHAYGSQPASEKPSRSKESKYKNQPVVQDGRRYASKREAARAAELKLLRKTRAIAGFAEQVDIQLPGGVRYRADFVILNWNGTYVVEDTKGVRTPEYKIKRKLMEESGLRIEEI